MSDDKVNPQSGRWQSRPSGDRGERGEKAKRPSHSHKSLRGQRSAKHLLRPEGTLQRWERPVAVVCAGLAFQQVGGSLSQTGLTSGQRGSITVSLRGLTDKETHTHTKS